MTEENVQRIMRATGRPAEEIRRYMKESNPSRRLIPPQEVAEAVLRLSIEECSQNGETIDVA